MTQFILDNRTITGAAFDMDGTLIDCSGSRGAIQSAVGSDFKIDWSQCGGRGVPFIHDWLVQTYPSYTTTKETFLDNVHHHHTDSLKLLTPRPGIIPLLNILRDLQIPIAVVTNTENGMAEKRLSQCGILDYMDVVIGSTAINDRGLKMKPAPDGYKLAAEMLKRDEKNMIGFEDSAAGMSALQATDYMTVHIYDETIAPITDTDFQIDARTDKDMLDLIRKIRVC